MLSILTGLGAGHKIFEIIRHKPHIPVKGGLTPAAAAQGAVTFENVCVPSYLAFLPSA